MTRNDNGSPDTFEELRRTDDALRDVRPSRDRFDRAALAGRRRRRRKVVVLATAAAGALFVVGAAILPLTGEPDRLVVTNVDVAPPDESNDASVVGTDMGSTSVATPSSVPTTTALPSESSSAVAPTPSTVPSASQPGDAGPESDSPSDVYVTMSSKGGVVIDVRNAVDVVASFDLTCPAGRSCVVQSARVMGDTIWVAITEAEPGAADVVLRSRVVSVSRSTGEIAEHLAQDGTAAVRSAGLGANGVLYAYLSDRGSGDRSLVAIEAGHASILETGVSGFRLSDDGRFLAVSFSNPSVGDPSRFKVAGLVDGSTAEFETRGVNAGPGAWSPDGRFLIVNEQWEDGTASVIDPWSGSGDPLPGMDRLLDGACFMSNQVIAHRTWDVGYGQGDAQPGVVRLTSLDTGSTIADFGDNIYGDGFRCHPDGSISYLRRPVVEVQVSPGFTQLEPDRDAPVELVHIATDGTLSILAAGDIRMI